MPLIGSSDNDLSKRKNSRDLGDGVDSFADTPPAASYNALAGSSIGHEKQHMSIPELLPGLRLNCMVLQAVLTRPRPSFLEDDIDEAAFQAFMDIHERSTDVQSAFDQILPLLTGRVDIEYRRDVIFDNPKYSIAPAAIEDAAPDFYDGVCPSALPKSLPSSLHRFIVPSTDPSQLYLPNFFLEGRAYCGDVDVSQNKILHDLALSTRGIHGFRKNFDHGQAWFDHEAYAIGAAYEVNGRHGTAGLLSFFTMHPVYSQVRGRTEYRMTELSRHYMCQSFDAFSNGVRAFRNARLWAGERREQLLELARRDLTLFSISSIL